MKKLLLLFSHSLTDAQKKDAKNMGVADFVTLPDKLQYLWSNVPSEMDDIKEYAKPFCEFIDTHANEGDFVLIQGDFGLTYNLVSYAKQKGLIPVYSTTKRKAKEIIKNGKVSKISEFKHVRFRKY
jgi:hypothetical protein